ncbi:MAG: molybdopterin-dependent oxidoreductase [Gammaproteobacteria bacterium]|nr:molybdopterin-dependent oxidoreductase [Gammaproteobacteria bacterium]
MNGPVKRRDFLKMMGVSGVGGTLAGCDLPSTVTLEEGKEDVVSYFMPEEYVIPGVGVWFASTCLQCDAGCGIHGRVREGRFLKVEGNPDSPINKGKTCQMGQAGVQSHYNPDRITQPMMREGGKLIAVSWEQANSALKQKLSNAGKKIGWFTGTISGHQSALITNYLDAVDASTESHFTHDVVNAAVWQAVNKDMLGDSMPELHMDKAALILSFGADFLGTWVSPVHFAGKWGEFRSAEAGAGRGTLIQVESKMTLTGGNADLWVPAKSGSEGAIALGLVNYVIKNSPNAGNNISSEQQNLISSYSLEKVAQIAGTSQDYIKRIGDALIKRSPSLVLAGASVEGHEHGYDAVAAIMLLNIVLGNVGKTIQPSNATPFPQLQAKPGNTRDLIEFTNAAKSKKFDVVFFSGSNPVFTAPDSLGLKDALGNVGFKVAVSTFPDETTMQADLVLPLSSYAEDWGTHVPAYQEDRNIVAVQQPLMNNLYSDTKGLGDILLDLLKDKKPDEYGSYKDYYAYLQDAIKTLRGSSSIKEPEAGDLQFWNKTLKTGLIDVADQKNTFASTISTENVTIKLPEEKTDSAYPYQLAPVARLGLYDGRHANLPWLQESPDQISKVVWDSWAEMHPNTAKKIGVSHGDLIEVASENGSIKLKAYIIKGVHPDTIAIPLGQGHEEFGRYAKGLGVNPLKILTARTDSKTGELAMYATRVKVTALGKEDVFVRLGGNDTQVGRKFVRTIPVEVLKRTEGA